MKKIIAWLVILSFVVAGFFYNNIDNEKIASHWNADGEVDDYMPKFWGTFLFPLMFTGLYLMYILIPKIDPLKKNIEKFRKTYDWFMLLVFVFLFYIFILMMLFNLGFIFNMTDYLLPGMGLYFILIGKFLKKLKRNWFIGIRTPWTISNDKVWEKTHILGGRFFKGIGVLIILGLFIPGKIFFPVFITFTIAMILGLFVYSWWLYSKEKK